MKGYRGTISQRMARKYTVDEATGCWNWHGAKDTKGYGQMRIAGKARLVTHLALELAGFPQPVGKKCALHKCDNPSCVNPDHLWWGTHKENSQDAKAKGRLNLSGLELGWQWVMDRKEPLPIVDCTNCGQAFTTSKFRFQNNKRHFCSTECCWGWQRANFTGAKRSEFGEAA